MRSVSRLAILSILVALLAAPAMAAGPMSTEIELASPFLKSSQNVTVQFTMTNHSDRAVRLLRWNTPFEGIEADVFEVARNGELIPYLGRTYKRGTPQADDFMVFAPGETRSTTLELSAVYDMHYGGEYVIRFRGYGADHGHAGRVPTKAGHVDFFELGSNQVVLWIDGEEAPIAGFARPDFEGIRTTKAKPVRDTCSNEQKATLATALAEAQNIAGVAASYLGGSHDPSSARYNEWFGNYSSTRWDTVDANFQAIDDALNNANVEFDCKCKQRYYAYVYSNEPYKIYLCRAFWSAPMTGTDSKAGTLVHEMSHFNVVAGTDDVTYGQSSCRSLANSNPNDAVRNADSHEYFAENTPFLP